jgi:Fic family protein
MSEYFEQNKEEYFDKLFNISARGDWTEWIEFCLRGTIRQAKDTISRCERLLQVRDSYFQRITDTGGSVRLHKIIENIFVSPFVRVADLPKQLQVSYPTAKSDVDRLVQTGILRELPDIWPKTLYAPEVYAVAYEELGE